MNKNKFYGLFFCTILVGFGMLGIHTKIAHSGWVLAVGLLGALIVLQQD